MEPLPYDVKLLPLIISFNSHNHPRILGTVIIPVFRWGDWRPSILGDLTRLVNGSAGIWTLVVWIAMPLCDLPVASPQESYSLVGVRGSWRVHQNWLLDQRRMSVSGKRLACVRVRVTNGHDVKGAARSSGCWVCQVRGGPSLSRTCRTLVHRCLDINLFNPTKAFQGWISWYFIDEEVDFSSDFWDHPE